MSSPIQISDDDDSLDEADLTKLQEVANVHKDIVNISSDEDNGNFTSDEETSLPEVSILRSNLLRNLFPSKASTSNSIDSRLPSNTSVKTEIHKAPISQHVPTCPPVSEPRKIIEKMIGGVKIQLPVDPYPCQTALMFKVITAIKREQNCLLESPTGSGKTLALLCGALAWQHQESVSLGQVEAQALVEQHPQLQQVDGAVEYIGSPHKTSPEELFGRTVFGESSIYDKPVHGGGDGSSGSNKRPEPMDIDYCDEFPTYGQVTIHKKRRLDGESSKTASPELPATPEKTVKEEQPETPQKVRDLYNLVDNLHLRTTMYVNCRLPTIYYGARTHKQLQQVIKEFSRTAYCGLANMTVLSSREHSCIREFDRSLWASKNDMCRGCVKKVLTEDQRRRPGETNCKYYDNRQALNHKTLPPAFDLEDLVGIGMERLACPYYAARAMAATAQIVFCPYNYLIEPGIRSTLQIDLQDNIVIIDEAHNIEDICRDAATITISWDTVKSCLVELEKCMSYRYANSDATHYLQYLQATLSSWDQWFNNQQPLVNNKPINNNEAVHTWEVQHFMQTLNNHNIGDKHYKEFKVAAEGFIRQLRESPGTLKGVTQATGTLIESMDTVLGYIFHPSGKYKNDFRPALIRTVYGSSETLHESRGWRNSQFNQSRNKGDWVEKETLSVRLLCLNPAVVFDGLKSAKCIILASGTLTPLVSLHSELATDFPLQVSPNHVISPDRVWIGTLTTCPNGQPLECNRRGTEQPYVQDALGECVLWVTQVTPHGVLCFLPSYPLMNKLVRRWQETGLWRKLNDEKHVFMENRNSKDHNDIMEDYYKYVSTSKGALLLAVYRGKVSEGMDFKDHQARAVITVGVPYPNLGDMAVKEKMSYNDKYSTERKLLPSGEWLRVQAYRALNQAVGRCVRHRNDWGAVLMVDARFTKPYYTEHLSKWVRNFLGDNHHTFESLVNSPNGLETFMQNMAISENEEV